MDKQDYVSQVGEPARLVSMLAMTAATLVCCSIFLLVVAFAIVAFDTAPRGPLIGCIFLFGVLSLASGWLAIRLIRRERSANGRTMMPEWFIQVFGAVFALGICTSALFSGRWWLFGEGLGVALTMLGVRRILYSYKPIPIEGNKPIQRNNIPIDSKLLDD